MNGSMEDIILAEIEKQRSRKIEDKVAQFNQICTRLGLQEKGINEITPHLREILEEEVEFEPYH
ncbi:hypothetical protein [Ammoniphilus sp. CFH 90114]|uniref:hypothetical protein n=1 Tax=Ammoniphilus sp. CFH 90114 TaxID=2493665 RepID=UPI00100F6A28|nr:hypothetical protein [Ammoniphilus sp. CFH 90114]RXT08128.1 hypothetical protein EIZ39_12050 [Ammoniphilus sp. CFH 90114]